ncbi:hypothetical protein CF326_g1966 [Tilletia indica]|nr:hypothetical protein CF326_g1966 [Tilletia indica]
MFCELVVEGREGLSDLAEKRINDQSAFPVVFTYLGSSRCHRSYPAPPWHHHIIPAGVPSVTLPAGILPTTGPSGVTDILLSTDIPRLTSLLPTATLPAVTDVNPTAIGHITAPLTVPVSVRMTGSVTLSGGFPGISGTASSLSARSRLLSTLSPLLPAVTGALHTGLVGAGIAGTNGLGVSARFQLPRSRFRDLDSISHIIPTGVPSVSLPAGVLPTAGLPAVTDILPDSGLPGVSDVVLSGLPVVTDILRCSDQLAADDDAPWCHDILPGTGLPGVTDIPTQLPRVTSSFPALVCLASPTSSPLVFSM